MADMGRPSPYRPEYDEQARKLCLLGATDMEMATFFEVTEPTIQAWKKAHPNFFISIKAGREVADMNVVQTLYEKAMNGDTTAQIFWMKNRRSKNWRDRQPDEDVKTQPINVTIKNFTGKDEDSDGRG